MGENRITSTELISARMLVELDKQETTTASLEEKLKDDLKEYKAKFTDQVTADIGGVKSNSVAEAGRCNILFKDKEVILKLSMPKV